MLVWPMSQRTSRFWFAISILASKPGFAGQQEGWKNLQSGRYRNKSSLLCFSGSLIIQISSKLLATPILKPHPIRTKCSGFVGNLTLKSLIEYYWMLQKNHIFELYSNILLFINCCSSWKQIYIVRNQK